MRTAQPAMVSGTFTKHFLTHIENTKFNFTWEIITLFFRNSCVEEIRSSKSKTPARFDLRDADHPARPKRVNFERANSPETRELRKP